jgi:hypothetical protein
MICHDLPHRMDVDDATLSEVPKLFYTFPIAISKFEILPGKRALPKVAALVIMAVRSARGGG